MHYKLVDNTGMEIPKFRDPLPEDRLTEKERGERIRVLDEFSKKLKKEGKRAAIDARPAIRQMLIYVGNRLELLDLENRHARGLAKYDFFLARAAKPVPQGLIGQAADVVLDLGLRDQEKMIRSLEEDTEPLVAEISRVAAEIDRLMDERQIPDEENYVLRPSACLPDVAIRDEDASPQSGSTPEFLPCDSLHRSNRPNGKPPGQNSIPDPTDINLVREWIEQGRLTIKAKGKTYRRNHLADKLIQPDYFTPWQRVVAVLIFGYDMSPGAIGKLVSRHPKTVTGHRKVAEDKMAKDPAMKDLLRNYKRKNRRSREEGDTSWPA